MGYYTYWNGTINLKDEKAIKLVRYLLKEEIAPFEEVSEVMVESDGEIDVSGEGKYYDGEIEKICYFIKLLDKDAEGEISCEGEDSFDIWKIVLNEKGVKILQGEVVYHKTGEDYKDKKTEGQFKRILNDKKLNKKLILNELKN